MGEIKAGVIVKTKFCRSGSEKFSSYINYIDRDEATRTDNSDKYNLYQDYMGNPEKTGGLFTETKDIKTQKEKEELKDIFKAAQSNGSLMWQTVISFDNRWLENNGLYKAETKTLDEERIKGITKSAIHKMLEKEGLTNAAWSAAIHYNTDNVHVHVATVEPEPMREKKEYVQYDYIKENGKYTKTPKLDNYGQPIVKSEYKGTFKLSSIETCKREVVNQIMNERDNNLKINSIIRDSILKQKRDHSLVQDRELARRFLHLYKQMPDCARNMWNYNNPIIHPVKKEIDIISYNYLMQYHKDEFAELKERLLIQEQKYKKAYGENNRNYSDTKLQDLYTRLGNAVLKEIRDFDKEIRQGNGFDIDAYLRELPEDKLLENIEKSIEKKLEVINDPQIKNEAFDFEEWVKEFDVTYANESYSLKAQWNKKFKLAKKLIHQRPPEYDKAIHILEKEHEVGNLLATYELGDIYRYGRGRDIDETIFNQYYKKALEGFENLYSTADEKRMQYLAYRIGKMYYYGLGTDIDYEVARDMFEESDNQYSKYMLGKMTYSGQGMEQDYDIAYKYFTEIANENAYAAYQAASMIDNEKVSDSDDARDELYQKAFDGFISMKQEQEDDNLEYRIGDMYLNGKGIDRDEEQAEFYLSKSAEAGNIYAKNKLATLYLEQGRTDKLPEIIETLTEVADKTNNIWSMYALGNIYASNEYGMKDMKTAVEWYLKAEREGNEFISYKLGKIYMDKEEGFYNLDEAIVHMEKAVENGNVLAGYQLGKIYNDKTSEYYNLDKAIHYFDIATEKDNSLAAYQLGKIYMNKQNHVYDINKAISYFEQAAKDDSEYATYRLGCIYYNEEYGVKDNEKAYQWFSKSEEKGNTLASYKLGKMVFENGDYRHAIEHFSKCDDMYSHYYLGKMYLDNNGPVFNLNKGLAYMEQSADEGNSFAELHLGLMYLKGEVVQRDTRTAREWLERAAEHGNGFADEVINGMGQQNWFLPRMHIARGVSITSAINKMKQGLKSEWEKAQAEREHELLTEIGRDD